MEGRTSAQLLRETISRSGQDGYRGAAGSIQLPRGIIWPCRVTGLSVATRRHRTARSSVLSH